MDENKRTKRQTYKCDYKTNLTTTEIKDLLITLSDDDVEEVDMDMQNPTHQLDDTPDLDVRAYNTQLMNDIGQDTSEDSDPGIDSSETKRRVDSDPEIDSDSEIDIDPQYDPSFDLTVDSDHIHNADSDIDNIDSPGSDHIPIADHDNSENIDDPGSDHIPIADHDNSENIDDPGSDHIPIADSDNSDNPDSNVPDTSDDDINNNNDFGEWMTFEKDMITPDFKTYTCRNKEPLLNVTPEVKATLKRPIDYFMLFFTQHLFQQITDETNRFTREKINLKRPLQKSSIWHDWVEFSVDEIKAFHAILLHMSLTRSKVMKDFFGNIWVLSSQFCKQIFARKRFLQLFWGLHVSKDKFAKDGKLLFKSKLQDVSEYLKAKFLKYYRPGPLLSADESTVPFKGRGGAKQYEPKKPHKWGMRVYDIACAVTGYVLAIIVYYGKETTDNLPNRALKFTTRIILALVESLTKVTKERGYHLFMDRMYTSLTLAKELFKRGLHLTGTINANRIGNPGQARRKPDKKLKDATFLTYKNQRCSFLTWMDPSKKKPRVVHFLSSVLGHRTERKHYWDKDAKVRKSYRKPVIASTYTAHMGGVDNFDHLCSTYAFMQKTLKWWRKQYFFFVEAAIVNSFILYKLHMKETLGKVLSHRMFRTMLTEDLAGRKVRNVTVAMGRPRATKSGDPDRLNGVTHFQGHWGPPKSAKECRVCSDTSVTKCGRRESRFHCTTCKSLPALHPGDCWNVYHSEVDFRRPKPPKPPRTRRQQANRPDPPLLDPLPLPDLPDLDPPSPELPLPDLYVPDFLNINSPDMFASD